MIDNVSKSIIAILYEFLDRDFVGEDFREMLKKHNIKEDDEKELSQDKRRHILRYLMELGLVRHREKGYRHIIYNANIKNMRNWIYRKAAQMKIPQELIKEVDVY